MIGAILQIIRMMPIAMSDGITMLENFPPHNLVDTVFAAQLTGWYVSHIMVFIAIPLLMVGFYGLYQLIKKQKQYSISVLGLVLIFIGLILYVIGAVIDGLMLPEIASQFEQSTGNEKERLGVLINSMHHLAICFGGPSFTHLLSGTGLLGITLRKLKGFNWLGIIGMVIGGVALVGYLTGILDLLVTKSFLLTGGLTMLMFVYYLILGFKVFKLEREVD